MINNRRARWSKHLIGIGVTLVCLMVFIGQIDPVEVGRAFSEFNWQYLIYGSISLVIGYAFRILRWSIMLRAAGSKVDFKTCSAPFLGSITLNNVLPLRIGDVVRALIFPASMGITKTTATSSLIVERLIDLLTLLACLAFGVYALQQINIPSELKVSALTMALVGCLALVAGFFFSKMLSNLFIRLANRVGTTQVLGKLFNLVGGVFHSVDAMSRLKTLVSMLCISVFVWVGEAGLFYFILLGSGIDGSPLTALLVMSVATLSTLLPSSPGYVGTFHIAVFAAVSLVGGGAAQAGSYAVLVHLALWIPTTLAGALAIWLYPDLFKVARHKFLNVSR